MATFWSDIQDRLNQKNIDATVYGPPSPTITNPFVRKVAPEPTTPRTVEVVRPGGEVSSVAYTPVTQPVAAPEVTVARPNGELSVGKFFAKAGVTFTTMAADTMQFVADYLSRNSPIDLVGAISAPDPILSSLSTKTPQGRYIAEKWTQLVTPAVSRGGAVVEDFTQKLQSTPYIQPSQAWQEAAWQDRFSPNLLGETIFNTGADVAGSVAGFVVNPTAGFAISAGSVAQGLKEKARENGVDEKTSDRIAIGAGLIIGAVDKIVPDEVLRPFGKAFSQRLGNFIFNTAKTAGKEALTEVAQEDIQMLAEVALRHDLSLDEFTSRNVMAAFGGLLGGGGMNTMATVVNTALRQQPEAVNEAKNQNVPMFKTAPSSNDPLLEKARKYDNVEDFIKSLGEPVYHGTNVKFDAFDKSKRGVSTGAKSAEKGFWFVDSEDVARGYGEYASEKPVRDILEQIKVEERKGNWDKVDELTARAEEISSRYADPVVIRANLNLKNPMVYDAEGKGFLATDKQVNDLIDEALKNGNDGLIIKNLRDNVYSSDVPATHTIVFDDATILTESQLRKIWERASKDQKTQPTEIVEKKSESQYDWLLREARKYENVEDFVEAQQATPQTIRVWTKSRFSDTGAYTEVRVIRKVKHVKLYQGGKDGDGRQFWTSDEKYAARFGDVTSRTGDYYQIDNGNRVTDVYVPVPSKFQFREIWMRANNVTDTRKDAYALAPFEDRSVSVGGRRRASFIPSLENNEGDGIVVEVESFGRKSFLNQI